MTDYGIGYFPQVQGGIFGQPDLGGADPVRQAALQEAAVQTNLRIKEGLVLSSGGGGYVPPALGYPGPSAPEWANQPGGPGNVATIGWTAQNGSGSAFPPYSTENIGGVPDWTSDANPAGAGAYDQTQVVAYGDEANTLNQAPIGNNDGDFFQYLGVPPNPNAPNTDVSGSVTLEW